MNNWQTEQETPLEGHDTREGQARSWIRRLALAVILVLTAVAALVVVILTLLARLGGEPLHLALEALRKDQAVVARLGEPIEMASWFPVGSVRVSGDRGNANLTFRVKGSREKALVNVIAQRIAGKWGLTTLEVTYSNGERQSVDVSGLGDSELDAPKWTPPSHPRASLEEPAQGDQSSALEKSAPDTPVTAPSLDIKIPEPPQK
ncbi:cytochrome c oxidase assembly factor Coa1 family protein [Thermogutta sp.]|uniref:cytochrome c oxidase assembly factor Coa1 family protein n=1 Tax=Thermogutta sp. TaxID=1962930 RepID=UPI00321F9A41